MPQLALVNIPPVNLNRRGEKS